jgi:cytochrome P450
LLDRRVSGAVKGPKVEQERVSGFERRGEHIVAVGDFGRRHHRRVRGLVLVATHEVAWTMKLAGSVGTLEKSNRCLGRSWVEGHVDADRLLPIDAVVGKVLVPGSLLLGAGFLAERMLVEQLGNLTTHKRRCHRGGLRVEHEGRVFGDPLPVAVAVEETPSLVIEGALTGEGVRRRMFEVALEASRYRRNPFGEGTAEQHDAVTLKSRDLGWISFVAGPLDRVSKKTYIVDHSPGDRGLVPNCHRASLPERDRGHLTGGIVRHQTFMLQATLGVPEMARNVTFAEPYTDDLGPDDANISDHDVWAAGVPHATFARLRDKEPVAWIDEIDGRGYWAVTRYEDAWAVSRNVETFTNAVGIRLEDMDAEETQARRTMMEMDPPDHTRFRRLVSRGFTPRVVNTYETAIRAIAVEVIERALPKGEFEFVTEIAQELPMRMLGRMLGTSDDDGLRLVEWGDALLGNTDPDFTDHPVGLVDTEEFRMMPFRSPTTIEIFNYAAEQAEARRHTPSDDVISQLLAPTTSGEPLTDLEFKNFFTLIIAAGNDTTRYTITHGLWVLLNHPHLFDTWRAAVLAGNTDLTNAAVEEVLRTGSVTTHFRRTATEDTTLGGSNIKAGDKVVMYYLSTDHDAARFPDPFRFDLARADNEHMAFGRNGPHFCLGAWLARMEIKVVFEELLKRVIRMEQNGPTDRLRSNFISGIKQLPVRIEELATA